MIYLFFAAVVGLATLLVIKRRPHLRRDVKDEFADVVREAKEEVDQSKQEKEAQALVEFYRGLARPALLLRPDKESEAVTEGARLGGPVWFADGEEWPRGPDGERLEFVAHLDFSRLPPLAGFPSQGVARFFVGRDDIWGVNFDAPDQSNVRVLWHDGPQSGGRTEAPAPWGEDENSPFESVSVRTDGLALRPEPIEDLPDFYSWQLQQRLEQHSDLSQETENLLFEIAETREYGHRIGGHPTFTQYDFRQPGKFDDFDVLLLGLSSDDSIMWGDVGEAGFYVRREDLDRRDFSRVAFYWDCH